MFTPPPPSNVLAEPPPPPPFQDCASFVICVSCHTVLSVPCSPCGHLLGRDWPLDTLVRAVFLCFSRSSIWCLGSGLIFLLQFSLRCNKWVKTKGLRPINDFLHIFALELMVCGTDQVVYIRVWGGGGKNMAFVFLTWRSQ